MDKLKKTIYFTVKNRDMLRKASYLSYKSQTEIFNKILEEGLKKYLENLENDEKGKK